MKDRLIVALDTDSGPEALEVARRLSGEVGMFKVGMELFPRVGPSLVESIRSMGADVFLDLKFHDIPNTVAGGIKSAVAMGVRFATVHAGGGSAMLKAAAEAAAGSNTTVLAVTVLTSLDDADLAEIGFSRSAQDMVVRFAEMAVACGIGGIVCSAREVPLLRSRLGEGVLLVTPGVRPAGGDVGDQKRVVTPGDAMRAGSDYLVVGRPVTKAADPVGAAKAIAMEMSDGFEKRGR